MIRFLQQKGRIQRVLLVGFLTVICISMVWYLVPGFQDALGTASANVIAKVGSREITVQEVQKQAQALVKQQLQGRNVPPEYAQFFMQSAMPRAAEGLILQNVFLAEAQRLGLDSNKDEMRYFLQHGPLAQQLFPNGQFIGTDQYAQFVQMNFNMSVPQFEEMVKNELTIGKLRDMVSGGATVSPQEMMAAFRRQGTKVKVQYAVLTLETLAKGINPSDAELRAYFEKNQQEFATASRSSARRAIS
jgi:peptidyl-prolyl cis-trans isomerase D